MSALSVIACPKCGTRLEVVPSRKYQCPKCGAMLSLRSVGAAPIPIASVPHQTPPSKVLSLDDENPTSPARGRLIGLGIVAILLAVGGVAAGVYFTQHAKQIAETVEAPAAKEPPAKAPPVMEKPADKPVVSELPKSTPPKPESPKLNAPTFLPEPTTPRELSGDEVYRRLLRSTAFILTQHNTLGSGVLIDSDRRLLLTNAHVVKSDKEVVVLFPAYDNDHQVILDVKHYTARAKELGLIGKVLTRSERQDLALVQLNRLPTDVRSVGFSKQPAATGITIYSIGGSGANDGLLWRLSTGIVRSRARQKDLAFMCLETQSATNKGDSGGPMVNSRVELVGIVQGGKRVVATEENLIDYNVDLSEVQTFVGNYFRSINQTWKEPETETELESSPNVPGSAAVFDNLLAVLKEGVPADRIAAARRLGNLRTKARPAIPALLAVLNGSNEELQTAVAAALTQIGAPEPGAEKALVQALRSKSLVARIYAVKLFATDTPVPADGINTVLEAIKDESHDVRALAVTALGKVGPKARPVALGPLLERLADKDPTVRDAAISALKGIGNPDTDNKKVLLTHSTHSDLRVRVAALALLGPLATTREDVLAIWVPLLKDSEPQLRLSAVMALSASRELLTSTEVDLIALLPDPDSKIRQVVALNARYLKDASQATDKLAKQLDAESNPLVKEALAGSLLALKV